MADNNIAISLTIDASHSRKPTSDNHLCASAWSVGRNRQQGLATFRR